MKKIFTILLFTFLTYNVFGQFTLNIGFDPKIGLIGTDNQYTVHSRINNFQIKFEHIDEYNNYLAAGIEYANLREWYFAYYVTGGKAFNLLNNYNFKYLASLEIGTVTRQLYTTHENDNRHNPAYLYLGFNNSFRYYINNFIGIELQGKVNTAPDLPNRYLRYSGYISILFNLTKPK